MDVCAIVGIIPRYLKLLQANIKMLIVRRRQLGFGYSIVGAGVAARMVRARTRQTFRRFSHLFVGRVYWCPIVTVVFEHKRT